MEASQLFHPSPGGAYYGVEGIGCYVYFSWIEAGCKSGECIIIAWNECVMDILLLC